MTTCVQCGRMSGFWLASRRLRSSAFLTSTSSGCRHGRMRAMTNANPNSAESPIANPNPSDCTSASQSQSQSQSGILSSRIPPSRANPNSRFPVRGSASSAAPADGSRRRPTCGARKCGPRVRGNRILLGCARDRPCYAFPANLGDITRSACLSIEMLYESAMCGSPSIWHGGRRSNDSSMEDARSKKMFLNLV